MKKHLLIILASMLVFIGSSIERSQAQNYNSSIGIGLGTDISVNYKHFMSSRSAIELQGAYNTPRVGLMLSAVYQYHVPLIERFSFYAGGGINIGALGLHHHGKAVFAVGITPTVGFEYSFSGAPIALAIDYKPNINFTTPVQLDLIALKIRFTW